jgi:hypothetical protein
MSAPERSVGKRIAMYVVALLVSSVAIYGFNHLTSDVALAKPGDCATASGDENYADYRALPCESANANVVVGDVVSTGSACDAGFTRSVLPKRGGQKLCLIPNFFVGDCFANEPGYPKVDCRQLEVMTVTRVVRDAPANCGDAQPLTFSKPLVTYCVTPRK